jgi:hypothetical protein
MSKEQIISSVSRGFHGLGFKFKKYSPEILLTTGIVSGVCCVISACKATRKLDAVMEKKRKFEEDFDSYIKDNGFSDDYTEEDAKKDLAVVNLQTGWDVVKLYAPAVGFGLVSIAAILGSHNILNKRYLASAAAYTATLTDFNNYRGRVVERFGEGLDRELRYNIKTKEVEETVVNEDGTESTVKKTFETVDPEDLGDYVAIFDEGCKGWTEHAEYNRMFLTQLQAHWNNVLRSEGAVFLNDIRRDLGLPRTRAGQVVGWVYDPKNPDLHNYIDFGMYNLSKEKTRDFLNCYERNIVLEFNCDGPVYELKK